jgi:cell division protein FtsL
MSLLGLSDADLAAGGGVGTFVLAAVAVLQMRHSRRQTVAMENQVTAIQDGAEKQLAAMRDEIHASVEQGRAVREAARAQLQPIVFAHAQGGAVRGPDEGADIGEGEVGFRYRLANEGTGVALNIRHGVEIDGIERQFGDGMEVRSMRPGESLPVVSIAGSSPFAVVFIEAELPQNWSSVSRTYWARFENVFGDQFETRNPHDPRQSAAFMRVEALPTPDTATS